MNIFKNQIFYDQFRQMMSTNGDQTTGTTNMGGDYSATATDFYVQPNSDHIFLVGTVIISISDDAKFIQSGYGAIAGGITNGVTGFITKNGVKANAFGNLTFKSNVDWFAVGSDVVLSSFDLNPQTLVVHFHAFSDTGGYIVLDGRVGDRIGLTINDNLSTLVRQVGIVRGISLYRPRSAFT